MDDLDKDFAKRMLGAFEGAHHKPEEILDLLAEKFPESGSFHEHVIRIKLLAEELVAEHGYDVAQGEIQALLTNDFRGCFNAARNGEDPSPALSNGIKATQMILADMKELAQGQPEQKPARRYAHALVSVR